MYIVHIFWLYPTYYRLMCVHMCIVCAVSSRQPNTMNTTNTRSLVVYMKHTHMHIYPAGTRAFAVEDVCLRVVRVVYACMNVFRSTQHIHIQTHMCLCVPKINAIPWMRPQSRARAHVNVASRRSSLYKMHTSPVRSHTRSFARAVSNTQEYDYIRLRLL